MTVKIRIQDGSIRDVSIAIFTIAVVVLNFIDNIHYHRGTVFIDKFIGVMFSRSQEVFVVKQFFVSGYQI
jgi:hypothetical protein